MEKSEGSQVGLPQCPVHCRDMYLMRTHRESGGFVDNYWVCMERGCGCRTSARNREEAELGPNDSLPFLAAPVPEERQPPIHALVVQAKQNRVPSLIIPEVLNTEPTSTLVENIVCCARCGRDHPRLAFKKFTFTGPLYTHYAPCPTNGEPVLLRAI
jgi:hypothetical protein